MATPAGLAESLAKAKELPASAAVTPLRDILTGNELADVESTKTKEAAVAALSEAYVKLGDAPGLAALLPSLRAFFAVIPKAKTAKIVRSIIDAIAKVPNSTQLQVEVCRQQAEWATAEKRTFLRQRIELRLAALHLEAKEYEAALALLSTLLTEVKRLDDKLLLLDLFLLESRVHGALRNPPKARASLTAARTAASSIYVPVALQADIDTQSGVLHAEEKDYKTAYSYFFEAFEQLNALGDAKALPVLKYMLLCKIMLGDSGDVPALLSAKAGAKHAGPAVDAMRAVARAHQERSLQAFQAVLAAYPEELGGDAIVHTHLSALYGTLLEQNLLRLIEPYSRVEVSHIAGLMQLPPAEVEAQLSRMILDRKLAGTLDQGAGCLEVFEPPAADVVYPAAQEVFGSMGRVVETLLARSAKVVG